jgi:serine/threonine protein kinase
MFSQQSRPSYVEGMFSLDPLHIFETVSLHKNFDIKPNAFPKESISGWLKDSHYQSYVKLFYDKVMFEGGHGILQLCSRTDLSGTTSEVLVKKPKDSSYLGSEAILQWIARRILKPYNLHTSIPTVYDIFRKGNETRFSMEFIKGDFPYVYLAKVPNPDTFFFQIIAQASALLFILERDLFLDHRDLKANNLYIREEPVEYNVDISGLVYNIKAPFQVVILDFGFACIGDESGVTRINIGSSVYPMTDPCPKEGRDLFHLVTSFWSIPSVHGRMSPETQKEVDSWLTKENRNFSRLAQKFKTPEWVYVVTSQPEFVYPKLSPRNLLERLKTLGSL